MEIREREKGPIPRPGWLPLLTFPLHQQERLTRSVGGLRRDVSSGLVRDDRTIGLEARAVQGAPRDREHPRAPVEIVNPDATTDATRDFVSNESLSVRRELDGVVVPVGIRSDLSGATALDPDDGAPGIVLWGIHERAVGADAELRLPVPGHGQRILELEGLSLNLEAVEVERRRKERRGPGPAEDEMAARNVGGADTFQQNAVLFRAPWEKRNLDVSAPSDGKEKSSAAREHCGVAVEGLARRESRQRLRYPATRGNVPEAGPVAAEENFPALGPGEPPRARRQFTDFCDRSAIPRDAVDGAIKLVHEGHRLAVKRENRPVAPLARNELRTEAIEVPNEELGRGLVCGMADKNHMPSVGADGERRARGPGEGLSLRKAHGESGDSSSGHGAHPPGR